MKLLREARMKLFQSFLGRRQFLVGSIMSASVPAFKKVFRIFNSAPAKAADASESAVAKDADDLKCVVIYSSMTGNTQKVAMAIQRGLAQGTGRCDIFPIKEANPRKLAGYDLIALGYPLMGPAIKMDVDDFVSDLRYVGGKHIFLFSTSHSGNNNHGTLVPKLKEHGLIIIGSKSWHGSVYGPLGDPTPADSDGHPDEADLLAAENFGKETAALSRKIYAGNTSLIPPEPVRRTRHGNEPPELVGSENDTNEEYMKRVHFKLVYEQDKCLYPTCRRCMDFCPVWGIDMTVEPRVIGDPCMLCMMCDQVCPTGAIYVDPDQMKWQAEIEHYAEKGVTQIYEVYTKNPKFIVGYGRPYGYDPYTKEDRGSGK